MKKQYNMRLISILLSVLFVVFGTISCTSLNRDAKVVIEGCLTNVPDSLKLNLYEFTGGTASVVATDTMVGGKFRFEVDSDIDETHRMIVSNINVALDFELWVEKGANIEISGEGLDFSKLNIKSNVSAQETEKRFIEATRTEISQKYLFETEYIPLRMKYYEVTSPEEKTLMRNRIMELQMSMDSINSVVVNKIKPLFETMKPDVSWLNRLVTFAQNAESKKDTSEYAMLRTQYERMDECLKSSTNGRKLANIIYPPQIIKVGDVVPDIELTDTAGNVHRLQELKGKFVLLDFWSYGCGPCIFAMPELKEISEQMKDSLVVVSISMDSEKMWKKASSEHGITWNSWNDMQYDTVIYARFGIYVIPHFCIISPEGKLLDSAFGYAKGMIKNAFIPRNIYSYGKPTSYSRDSGKLTIDNPTSKENNTFCLYIDSIELSDNATDITFKAFYVPNQWIKIAAEAHLITDKGEKLQVVSATGIELGKEFYMPETGIAEFTLHFKALPKETETISFYEEENGSDDSWRITDICVKEK